MQKRSKHSWFQTSPLLRNKKNYNLLFFQERRRRHARTSSRFWTLPVFLTASRCFDAGVGQINAPIWSPLYCLMWFYTRWACPVRDNDLFSLGRVKRRPRVGQLGRSTCRLFILRRRRRRPPFVKTTVLATSEFLIRLPLLSCRLL